jgi:hypothetical protein
MKPLVVAILGTIVALTVLTGPSSAWAESNSPTAGAIPGCPLDSKGPVIRLKGDQGEWPFELLDWKPGTIIDARGATWAANWADRGQARNCHPIMLGISWGSCPPDRIDLYSGEVPLRPPGPPICLVGGSVSGTQPDTLSWHEVKRSNGAAVTINADHAVVQGMRISNAEDAFVPFRSVDFTIRGNWVSYNRDDCVENDAYASGVIEDNLFEGCYVFYSTRNNRVKNPPVAPGGGPNGLVTIRGNLIWLQNMPGPYKKPKSAFGFGMAFKASDAHAPALALHGNIFLIEQPIDAGRLNLYAARTELRSCSDNIVVWLGQGDYPAPYPRECFTITHDVSVWEDAKRRWIERHPDVPNE